MHLAIPPAPAHYVPGKMTKEDSAALAKLAMLIGREEFDGNLVASGEAALGVMNWLALGGLKVMKERSEER